MGQFTFTVPIKITYEGVFFKEVTVPYNDPDLADQKALEAVWKKPPQAEEIEKLNYVDADYCMNRETEAM